MPTETTLNSLKVHKVPDFETWEENYNQTNGIGTNDVVVIPPEELKKGILPDQTNNSGKFLSTNGTSTSWETVDALPSQSGNSGKFLTTNGTAASWGNIPENIFIAEKGVTSFTDILTAYNANKIIFASDTTYKDSFWLQNILYAENGDIDTFVFSKIENHKDDIWWQSNNSRIQLICVICSYDTSHSNNTHWQNAVIPLQEEVYALSNLSGNTGKYLSVQQDQYGTYVDWANIPEKVFIATYNTTTYADVLAAYNAGKTLFVSKDGYWATLGTYSSDTFNFYVFIMGTCYRYSVSSTGWTTGTLTFQISLPSQSNNSGKYLTTNGSSLSWANSPVTSVNTKSGDVTLTASDVGAVATSAVGAASGVAPLNASSKIDSTYLPSYVDDVIEGYYYNSKFYTTSAHTTEITGETGKIFVDLTTNKTYRYGGSSFTEISQGSVVSVSRDLTSGTKIGTLTINGTGTDLYAPTPETFTVTGGASTIVSDNLTANRALISNTNGKVAVSDVTSTELGYLDGVTSAIQTQINDKQAKITASGLLKGDGSGGVSAATAGTDYQAPLPSQTNNSGKFLTTNGSSVSWANAPEETFVAIYQTTTFSEILQAYNEGKILYAQLNTNTNLKYFLDQIVWSSTEATINEFRFFVIDDEHNDPWAVSSNIKLRGLICSSTGGFNGWSNITRTLQENVEALSSLSGNSGKFLTTNGSALSWGTVDALPSQTGNSGKYLTTNGTTASWGDSVSGSLIDIDSTPTASSNNLVTSGGVYTAIQNSTDVFIAEYGTTTYNEIATAIAENKNIYVNSYGPGHEAPREYGWFCFIGETLATGESEIRLRSYTFNSYRDFYIDLNNQWSSSTAYVIPSTQGSILKSNNQRKVSAAVADVDYQTPLPSQSGNSGKFLTTNGSAMSWGTVDALPSQSGNSGKYLTTNGSAVSWANAPEGVFIATYNSTTYADIVTAYNAGKIVICKNSNRVYVLHYYTDQQVILYAVGSNMIYVISVSSSNSWSSTTYYFVPTTRTINSKDLSSNITLDASDVGAASASHIHGNITNNGDITTSGVTIANGDRLIINDESASKIENSSITFDGSTTSKYLSQKGSWESVPDALPSQTGNSGKYLTTNGSSANWGEVSAVTEVTLDTTPTQNSTNPITSGAVYSIVLARTNRTTNINSADTNYTTLMARGEKLLAASTFDSATWSNQLVNGAIAWRYE